jgi:hypothetical protein
MLPRFLRRYPVPLVYMAILCLVSLVWTYALPKPDMTSLVNWASTNVANLAVRPVVALVASAFVSDAPILVWAVLTTTGLVLLAHCFGNWRTAFLSGTAHVVGTLVSEGIAAARLAVGAAPAALRHIADVGPSYVTVSALAAVACFGPSRRHRAVAAAGLLFLAPFLFGGIAELDVAAVGHAVAVTTGLLLGARFRNRGQLRPAG